MKKFCVLGAVAAVFFSTAAIALSGYPVQAAQTEKETIYKELTIGPVDVGGMTKAEAAEKVNAYVEELRKKSVTLIFDGNVDKKIEASVADLGFQWANTQVFDGMNGIVSGGNIIRRYKKMKDLENTPFSLDIEFCVDEAAIQALIEAQLPALEEPAADAVITKTAEGFSVVPEKTGKTADVEASVAVISDYILNQWDYEDCSIELVPTVLYPNVTKEDCEKISTEPMGEFVTSYQSSGQARSSNIDVAVRKINGCLLMPGEVFSCLEYMVPFTAENGYFPAGAYMNGKLVDSYGGGVCQVSTTLYNAVLLAELEINQRNNHGLTVGYVQLSADAAVAESSGMDFKFTNNTDAPIYIEGFTKGKEVTFRIYGKDERPANRTIAYKNVVVEVLNPPEDVVTEDPAMPAGVTEVTQSSHTGYRTELYKYVYIDGVESARERVNTSYYAPAPNYVTVGTGPVQEVPAEETVPSEIISADTVPEETAPEIPVIPEDSGQMQESVETETVPDPQAL